MIEAEIEVGFETALAELKAGGTIARKGWNGKGMFVTMQHGHVEHNVTDEKIEGVDVKYFRRFDQAPQDRTPSMPFAVMYTAGGNTVPWNCSQTDMFADDWVILD